MDDVLIVGGGPAGAVAGVVLARAGARVRIVDRAVFPRDKLCGDTINPGTLATLKRLGLAGALEERGRPIAGMVVTVDGVSIRGPYADGAVGRALLRRDLDSELLDQAIEAGASFEPGVSVTRALTSDDGGTVVGVAAGVNGMERPFRAPIVIAADGRRSKIAFGLGAARHPRRPRRWAIGAYFDGVSGTTTMGEMHIQRGRYIGVAPVPGGVTNVCVVLPLDPSGQGGFDAASLVDRTIACDPILKNRFANARRMTAPVVLGPLAVDVAAPSIAGLLLAGDAAGFVDPMTGDGLRFAVRGGELAARAALDALAHGWSGVHERLAAARQREFAAKWRFDRALRALVASGSGVRVSGALSAVMPGVVRRIIAFAGDCSLV
jgi:flavin-dependent dehydrogenase